MRSSPADQPPSRPKNRRAATRYRFSADIEIECGSTILWGKVHDISREGMFIEMAETPGLKVHTQFSARLGLDPIWCVVRRVVPGQGIGVVIVVVDKGARLRFKALLSMLRTTSGPVTERPSDPLSTEPFESVSASRGPWVPGTE